MSGQELSAEEREALEAACLEGLVLTEHGYRYRPATGADAVERIIAARLAQVTAERDAAEAKVAAVRVALMCTNGLRHYYAIDATCQRCEMPSWVEALIRAALDSPGDAQGGGV